MSGGLQSLSSGFQEGPLKNKGLKLRAYGRSREMFFLTLKDDELVMSEMGKGRGSPTLFWREHARKNT